MEKYYKIVYNIIGIPKFLRGICKKELLKCHNEWADKSNKLQLYEKWNAEYDSKFGTKTDPESIAHYMSWISEKSEQFIQGNIKSYILSFTVDRKEAIMVGHLKLFPKSKIDFYLKEVEL